MDAECSKSAKMESYTRVYHQLEILSDIRRVIHQSILAGAHRISGNVWAFVPEKNWSVENACIPFLFPQQRVIKFSHL